jgi:hypothetical protein
MRNLAAFGWPGRFFDAPAFAQDTAQPATPADAPVEAVIDVRGAYGCRGDDDVVAAIVVTATRSEVPAAIAGGVPPPTRSRISGRGRSRGLNQVSPVAVMSSTSSEAGCRRRAWLAASVRSATMPA